MKNAIITGSKNTRLKGRKERKCLYLTEVEAFPQIFSQLSTTLDQKANSGTNFLTPKNQLFMDMARKNAVYLSNYSYIC